MSGKRSQKKQQKRQASAVAQLEALYQRGTGSADDELLARAAELGADLAASPFAARWAEVADRAVRQSLARADFGRLDRLLKALRRNGPPRPLASLAKAVLDLAAGRLDEARASLSAVEKTAATGTPGDLPPRLLADLQTLAGDGTDPPWRDDACPRAAAELFASLQALEAGGFAPTAAERETLAHHLQTLRGLAPPEDLEIRRLLDGADRCLSLLADLETTFGEDETPKREDLVAWLRRSGAALGAAAPPLLAPLQHAVVLRWRGLLERVAARQGTPGLAALGSADPKLLAPYVDLPRGGGQESFRQRAQARQLLARERYAELADLLRARSRSVSAAADLAALWSLELWVRGRRDPDDDKEADDLPPELAEPPPHRTLVRLGEMAVEIGRRIPAEQRAGVARVLAGELFDLCDAVGFCDHTAEAALSLLEHQPDDLGLLLAGIAGSLAANAPRALRALQVHFDRGVRVTAGDLPIARRLMAQVAREEPRALARILAAVGPMFSAEAWPEILELVAREMGGAFAQVLSEASFAVVENPNLGERALDEVRKALESLRPALAGTLGFAAVELALDCSGPDLSAVETRLTRFLAASPGWETALAALEVLDKARRPWSPKGMELARHRLARAVIDRLDDRWQLWGSGIPALAFAADPADLKRLEKKVRQLLAAPEIQGQGREDLVAGLRAIEEVQTFRRLFSPRRQRAKGAKRQKKRRRRPARSPQLGLDFP